MKQTETYIVKSAKFKSGLAILFPFIALALSFIPITLSNHTHAEYIERVYSNNGLYVKFIVSLVLGFFGLSIWFVKVVPKAIRSFSNDVTVQLDKDGRLFYNGKFILKMEKGGFVFLRQSFMENTLIASNNEKEMICGEITYISQPPDIMVNHINDILKAKI